jgi:hypothetical protein
MSTVEIIILIVAGIALIAAIGWRAPERKPISHEDELD